MSGSDNVDSFIEKHPAFSKAIAAEVIARGMLKMKPRAGLTKRHRDVLDFIEAYLAENRFSPSYDEIGEHIGSHRSKVYEAVTHLVERGYIRKIRGKARSIEIINRIA